MSQKSRALAYHSQKPEGKIGLKVTKQLKGKLDLAYTPGVADVCLDIKKNKKKVWDYTAKGNSIAIITDGSRILGLGNIGPEAGLPVMEGKAVLFKALGDVDAYPIPLATQNADEIVKTVKAIAPMFGGINLEDIESPKNFEIENRLTREMDIPVFHDDQHGTAVVIMAGLINSLKIIRKDLQKAKIVINGAGAAGIATARLLKAAGVHDLIIVDSFGCIYRGRKEDMNSAKRALSAITNPRTIKGPLSEALAGADVFIGVSVPGALNAANIKTMAKKPIVFALSNPIPEIAPEIAKKAGAVIVATGRSDKPNQINNVLAFPGIFRGLLDCRARRINIQIKLEAAHAIASLVKPNKNNIVPHALDKRVPPAVAVAVVRAAMKTKVARRRINNLNSYKREVLARINRNKLI